MFKINQTANNKLNIKNGLKFLSLFSIVFISIINFSSKAFGQSISANLDQGENGKKTARISPVNWVNANLNPNNAHFAEGYSIPYRLRLDVLGGNAAQIHTVVIEWDTKDQNGHAIDYITHYQNLDNPAGSHQFNFSHAAETVTPTIGTPFSGAPSDLIDILPPSSTGSEVAGQPTASFNALPAATGFADVKKMAIWGGTFVDMAYVFQDNQDATTNSTKTQLAIRFRSTDGVKALIAWGGHIAAEYDWGTDRGASEVSGSPYHMRLISVDGSGGNQDRSLKATTVLIPTVGCTLSAAQTACEGTSAGLTYSVTGSPSGVTNYSWTLTPGTTNATIQNGNTTTTKSGATVTSITIVPGSGQTFAPGTFTVSLTLTNLGGAGTPCTRTGTIDPAVVTNAGPDQTVCSSSPDVTLAGSVSGGATTGTWSGGTGTFNPNNTTLNAVYTPSAAEITAGTVTLTLTSAEPAGPCAATSNEMIITIDPAVTTNAGPDQTVCASSPDVTLAGSVSGGATTGTWSGGSGTFNPNNTTLNAVYTPSAAEIAAGSVTLTLTSAEPAGPCAATSNDMVINITANPVRPTVTYQGPECDETTFSVTVVNAVTGGSYELNQDAGGLGPITKTTAADANTDGDIVFSGLTIGKGFSIVLTVGDCSSDPTDCDNYKTPVSSSITNRSVQTTETVNARIAPQQSKVVAVPNPFSSKIKFNLESAVSGQGSLELFNMMGQKVKTVFQGRVEAGQIQTIEYNVPGSQRSNLIYVFRVGEQKTTGKLIGLQ